MEPSSSPVGTLNKIDYFKTLRGGVITLLSGIGVELLLELQKALQVCVVTPAGCQFNFGTYNFVIPVAISIVGMVVELIRRLKTPYSN